jgi:hypothetical protein
MKIVLCGSMYFVKRILEIKAIIEKMRIETFVSNDLLEYQDIKNVNKEKTASIEQKIKGNLIKLYFNQIKESHAILVVNEEKNRVKNYIGANTFLEIGFAHVLDKLIFLLNPIPNLNYTDEIRAMKPIILNGDLRKLEKYST